MKKEPKSGKEKVTKLKKLKNLAKQLGKNVAVFFKDVAQAGTQRKQPRSAAREIREETDNLNKRIATRPKQKLGHTEKRKLSPLLKQ